MRYISEADLRAYLINDGCDDGCGYLDERDIPSLPWIELDATDDDVLDKIRAEIADLEIIDYDYEGYYQEGYCKAITDVSQIIDKYREGEL